MNINRHLRFFYPIPLLLLVLLLLLSCEQKPVRKIPYNDLKAMRHADSIYLARYPNIDPKHFETAEDLINQIKTVRTLRDMVPLFYYNIPRPLPITELDFNTTRHRFWRISKLGERTTIVCVVQNDTIRYGLALVEDSLQNQVSETLFANDTVFINWYVNKHNALYGATKIPNDFIREVIHNWKYLRIGCGYAGVNYGGEELQILKAVGQKDVRKVYNLLTAINPEQQTLGIIGMNMLFKSGYFNYENSLALMEHLKRRNSRIDACYGCGIGYMTMNWYLSANDFARIPKKYFE